MMGEKKACVFFTQCNQVSLQCGQTMQFPIKTNLETNDLSHNF